jgi:hypothetical protein
MSTCFDTAINSQIGQGFNKYNIFTIKAGCILYHGSPRLKYIHDYLNENGHYLTSYLSIPKVTQISLHVDLIREIIK